ncbi:piwi B [Oopsacas minuta]|uniref:Piwi B n=1 Tax=Oopsacas minuta TaxID=111878 RepID=A0AAV7K5X2_9METZ|nr:piwi B [Oopsacas minuta]
MYQNGRGAQGFGRGGRGEALLKAAETILRRPGEQVSGPLSHPSTQYPSQLPPPPPLAESGTSQPVQPLTTIQQPYQAGYQQQTPVYGPSSYPQMPYPPAVPAPVAPLPPSSVESQSTPTSGFGRGVLRMATSSVTQAAEALGDLSLEQRSGSLIETPSSGVGTLSVSNSSQMFSPTFQGSSTSGPLTSQKTTNSSLSPQEIATSQITPILREKYMGLASKETISSVGTAGTSTKMFSNYIRVRSIAQGVYHYMVTFSPEIDSKNMRYKLLNMHREVIGETRAFDGTTLYSPKTITESIIELESTRPTDGAPIKIKVEKIRILQAKDSLQLFNVIFRRVMRQLQLRQVGRHYYDPIHPINIPQHKLELWPGYITSIHAYEDQLLLMLDVSHKLLRTDSALDFLYDMYHQQTQSFQEQVTKQLVGTVVLTRYNNNTYRVDDIEWNMNPQSTFTSSHTGETISFEEYYKKQYQIEIVDKEQPLLIHRMKKRRAPLQPGQVVAEQVEHIICLVPELCFMTGLTETARADFKVMKDVAIYTRLSARERIKALEKFVINVENTPEAKLELEKWGLKLEKHMIDIDARVLPIEKINFRNTSVSAGKEADWGRDLTKENVITPVQISHWLLIFTKRDHQRAFDFYNAMSKVCPPMGISIDQPKVIELADDRTDSYLRGIRENLQSTLQLVVTIFPTQRDDRYSAVKKLCCIDSPVPSQVINSKTISNPSKLRSVAQKIALQINCKLGGELWALDIPLKNLMVVGIDVYHDTAQGRNSIGAFVASSNHLCTRWYSRVTIQMKGQEIVDGLKTCLVAALRKYHDCNGVLPERIIVYRDGVGDGQMSTVNDYEVPQLLSCFESFLDYHPKFATVVVQKRINTRIFVQIGGAADNAPPGSIVDHTITRMGWYDFFLVSQHVRQGTVTPTHYNVVYDTSGLKPDHMQRLSYKLTHLYYNWPGTVRVPAPCQYAHKLAFLVGQSLHKSPNLELSDRLFFL